VLGCDETSKQLLTDTRSGVAMNPGKPRRRDDEDERNGVRNIVRAVDPQGAFRTVSVTRHRRQPDCARDMERMAGLARDRHAKHSPIVLDHLNTHGEQSLIETCGPDQTKRMRRRIRFHDTPQHGSWLHMAEIELSSMGRQCVHRRIPPESTLVSAVASWEQRRHSRNATINGSFTKQLARRIFKDRQTAI
jgi:DDE superfamily endonuclease